jgi:outer membrane biosynthesis protein TonB
MGSEKTNAPAGSEIQRRGGIISDSPVERHQRAVNEIANANETGADDLGALALFGSEVTSSSETPAVARDGYVPRPTEDPVRSLRTRLATDSRFRGSRLLLKRMTALKLAVGDYGSTVPSLVASRSRDYLVRHPKLPARAGLIACIVVAAAIVGHYVGRIDLVPSQPASPARLASEPLAGGPSVVPTPIPSPTAKPQPADPPRDVRSAPMPVAPKAQTPTSQRSTINVDNSNSRSRRVQNPRPREIGRETSTARRTGAAEALSVPPPSVSAAAPVVPANTRQTPTPSIPASPVQTAIANNADESSSPIYSAQDVDVRPPQMLEAELPRPAVLNWPTIKNSMEVIVTEDGSVQHVKLLTSRERMPDVMLLSRAKLWKFSPAIREGQPVRYRLILTWEVNP